MPCGEECSTVGVSLLNIGTKEGGQNPSDCMSLPVGPETSWHKVLIPKDPPLWRKSYFLTDPCVAQKRNYMKSVKKFSIAFFFFNSLKENKLGDVDTCITKVRLK